MRGRLLWVAAMLAAVPFAAEAQGFDGSIKIGVLNDMSSLYQDTTGPGSVAAVQMAVEDYAKANPKSILKPVIVSADHQNKPDIGAQIAREWYERDGVDVIVDVPNSAVALAVSEITGKLNKVNLNASAGTAALTGSACNANTIHWNFDNYALANVTGRAIVATGGDSWFFITADYAFGHDLEAQTTAVVKAQGGKVWVRCARRSTRPTSPPSSCRRSPRMPRSSALPMPAATRSTRSSRPPSSASWASSASPEC